MTEDQIRQSLRRAASRHGISTQQVVAEVEGKVDKDEPRRRGWVTWVSLGVSLVAVGGVLGFVIVFATKFINDPVESAGAAVAPKVSVEKAPATAQTALLSGLNFQFSYPGMFNQLAHTKSGGDIFLEQYSLSSKDPGKHAQVSVMVRAIPSGELDDDPSYRLRKLHPETYTPKNETASGSDKVSMMTRKDNAEKTMFWLHKGKELTVDVSSTDPKDGVEAIMTMIEGSMKWH